jgi:hypothetical protein
MTGGTDKEQLPAYCVIRLLPTPSAPLRAGFRGSPGEASFHRIAEILVLAHTLRAAAPFQNRFMRWLLTTKARPAPQNEKRNENCMKRGVVIVPRYLPNCAAP